MGRVHVHQHQAVGVLGEDVDALELRQGVTQRRDVLGALGQRGWRLARGQRREVGLVGATGLGQRRRRLQPEEPPEAEEPPLQPTRAAGLSSTLSARRISPCGPNSPAAAPVGRGSVRLVAPGGASWSSGRTSPSARCKVP